MQAQAEQPRVRRYWWLVLLLLLLWIGWRWIIGAASNPFSRIITPNDVGILSPVDEAHRNLQRILHGTLLPEELQQVLEDYAAAVEQIRITLPLSEFQDWKRNQQQAIHQATIDAGLRQRLLAIVDPTTITPFIGPTATPTATPTSTPSPTNTATSIPTLILPPLFPIVRPTATQAVPIPPPPSAIPTVPPATTIPTTIPTAIPTPPRPTATIEPLPTEIPLPSITPLPSPIRSTPLPAPPTSGPYPYPYPSGE